MGDKGTGAAAEKWLKKRTRGGERISRKKKQLGKDREKSRREGGKTESVAAGGFLENSEGLNRAN